MWCATEKWSGVGRRHRECAMVYRPPEKFPAEALRAGSAPPRTPPDPSRPVVITESQYLWQESPGTAHQWLTWRRDLNEFLPGGSATDRSVPLPQ
jgi:hypothetical protein